MKAHTLNAEPNHVPATVMGTLGLGLWVPPHPGLSGSTCGLLSANDWPPLLPPLFTLAVSAKRAREGGGRLGVRHQASD